MFQLAYSLTTAESTVRELGAKRKKGPLYTDRIANRDQVFMMFRPAGRFLMRPLPPFDFAARFFAAVIRPPLLIFAMVFFVG